jgi:multicomponent Na+:H+ antiporter subunit B
LSGWLKAASKACALVLLVALTVAILMGATAYTPSLELRPLAEFYLESTLNVYDKSRWAAAPEAVTAMLWDYRGLDTVFESTVFILAVVGSAALFRFSEASLLSYGSKPGERLEEGLSIIVRVVTRIVFALIVALSAAIAFHGHLTPGGGFQAGSILSIAPLLAIAALSRRFVEGLGLTKNSCRALEAAGFLFIASISLLPLATVLGGLGACIIQNQQKPWLPPPGFSYPFELGPIWTGGSLILFNVAEYLAVSSGFTLLFILLALPEEFFRGLMRR